MSRTSISIIGGGITGACVAYHLSEATDRPITVYERQDELAAETTNKSGAFIGYWGHEGPGRLEMMRYSMRLYNEFLADLRTDLSYHHAPRLEVATSASGASELQSTFEDDLGVAVDGNTTTGVKRSPVQFVEGDLLDETFLHPELATDGITGAMYSPNLGHLWPAQLVAHEFVERARENGIHFETGCTVNDVVTTDGSVTSIVVDGEERSTGDVVYATGPWNRKHLRDVGIDLPIRHTLGPMLVLRPEVESPHSTFSLGHEETGTYMRQNPDGTVFVGNYPGDYESADTEYDPTDVEDTVPEDLRQQGLDVAKRLFPYLDGADVVDEWVGIRSLTPDTEPIVGWTSVQGLSVVSFNASGIQLAPAAGRIVRDQLVHDDRTPFYDHVSISRFEGYDDAR